uniref:Uncharacterized protein n=1 Tax=Rhizophora mucronata TaxID=61149 RepID=A0A2P2NPW8_RHIMU
MLFLFLGNGCTFMVSWGLTKVLILILGVWLKVWSFYCL